MKIKSLKLGLFKNEPTDGALFISFFILLSVCLLMMFLLDAPINSMSFEAKLSAVSLLLATSTIITLISVFYSFYKKTLTKLIEDIIGSIVIYMAIIIMGIILINIIALLITFFKFYIILISNLLRFLIIG